MLVYRIGRTRFARDITGEGARLNGGRWNHPLTPCIYTSESRALAVLEYTVNINMDDIPRALSVTTFELSDNAILAIKEDILPGNWKQTPAPASSKDFGTQLLQTSPWPILRIPSSVISGEFNYLLNPLYVGNRVFTILEVKDFVYDIRIKAV